MSYRRPDKLGFVKDKFAYNNSINNCSGLSSFKIDSGRKPRVPRDLLLLPIRDKPSASVESFAQHWRNLHTKIH